MLRTLDLFLINYIKTSILDPDPTPLKMGTQILIFFLKSLVKPFLFFLEKNFKIVGKNYDPF